MIYNLHLLRAIAALAVVYHHITSEAGLNLAVSVGAHGVDLFFVISGFIIAHIGATQSPGQFLVRRLLRVVPFYWAATLFLFAIVLAFPHMLRSTQADWVQLACSLLFIPRETDYAGMFPTMVLGWSLNYEMYFYLVFAAALALSRRHAPALCCAMIALVVSAIDLSGATHPSVLFYARTLVFEFTFGIGVYYVLRYLQDRAATLADRKVLRLAALAVAPGAIALLAWEEHHSGFGLPRFLVAGLPATALVLSALVLEQVYGMRVRSRLANLIGESSYILYLVHPYIIYGALRTVFRDADQFALPATAALVVGLMVASTVISVAIHMWFEKPLLEYLRGKLLRPSNPAAVARPAA